MDMNRVSLISKIENILYFKVCHLVFQAKVRMDPQLEYTERVIILILSEIISIFWEIILITCLKMASAFSFPSFQNKVF